MLQDRIGPVLIEAPQTIKVIPRSIERSCQVAREVLIISVLPAVTEREEVLDSIGEPLLEFIAGFEAVRVTGWTGAADCERRHDGCEESYVRRV
jgi:hypothetical protein